MNFMFAMVSLSGPTPRTDRQLASALCVMEFLSKQRAAKIHRVWRSRERTEGPMAANQQLRRARLAALLGAQAATAARDADGLSITGLRAVRVREPVSRRSYTVVRLEIRSGLTGFGECGAVVDTALERARAIVVGKTATAYEVLSRALADLGEVEAAVIMALL